MIPAGIIYFFLYYFIFRFLIVKFDFKTPGREEDTAEIKLYTRADVNARKDGPKKRRQQRILILSALLLQMPGRQEKYQRCGLLCNEAALHGETPRAGK